jgi:alditol oxidase
VTAELRNWSGTYRFTAREVIHARTVDDVRRAVAAGGRVRALGTRHSFNDLADNGATLVSVAAIAADPVLDEAARTVTVGAGMPYGALAAWLQGRGWALGNLGSLPHISIGGATATGTHGSGSRNKILSAAVAGLDYVAADGELRHASRADPDFDGLPVGLGAFGVTTRITLDVEPAYLVRQDAYTALPWDRVLAELDDIMSAAYSVSLFTDWSEPSLRAAWVKRRVASAGDARAGGASAGDARADAVPDEFFGARREPGPVRFIDAPADNLTVLGVPGPWAERLPHFRLDATPSNGDEIQSEYFVDRRHGADAIAALRRRAGLITPLLLISEIRATAADQLWLSGSYGRETLALHFTWRNAPDAVDLAVGEVEAALAPFAARPHWGKVSHVPAAQLADLYPRLGDARDLFERLDPGGRFSNDRLERLGVRAGQLTQRLPLAPHRAPHRRLARVGRAGLRPPVLKWHDAGFHQVRAGEEARHLIPVAVRELLLDPAARHRLHFPQCLRGEELRAQVREREVAAGRHGVHHPGHDRIRVVGVRYRVQDRDQRDRHRLREVKQSACLAEDGAGVAQVGVDVLGGPRVAAGEQRAGVGEHDRVVVHVHHTGLRRDRLGDLVGVARRRDAGADVEELPDPRLGGEVADDAAEERPVGPRGERPLGVDLECHLGLGPVGGVIVLAAKQVVVNPRLMRDAGVELRRPRPRPRRRLPARAARPVIRRPGLVAGHLRVPFMSPWPPAR